MDGELPDFKNLPIDLIQQFRSRAIALEQKLDDAIARGRLCPKCFNRANINKTCQRIQYMECPGCGNRFKRTTELP